MSSSERILANLQELYRQSHQWQGAVPHVIIWLDPEREFEELYQGLELPGVQKFALTGKNYWRAKLFLYQAKPQAQILIYQPFQDPEPELDWLLDVRLYGKVFSAQRAQLIYQELGLQNHLLRPFIQEKVKFFDNQERVRKLQHMLTDPLLDQASLTQLMMAVLLNLSHPEPQQLIRTVLAQGLEPEHNPKWAALQKFFQPEDFFALCQREFKLNTPPHSLRQLFSVLAVTHVAHHFNGILPSQWKPLILKPTVLGFSFVDRWLHDSREATSWYDLAAQMEADLQVLTLVQEQPPDCYLECETFQAFDKGLLLWVRENLLGPHPEYSKIQASLQTRQNLQVAPEFRTAYQALAAASRCLHQIAQINPSQLRQATLHQLSDLYTNEAWQIDQAYRHFWAAADLMPETDLLRPLQNKIEQEYQRFIMLWGEFWGDRLSAEGAWPLAGWPQQSDVFAHSVWKKSQKGENRAVVIISDALRYEVALELQERIQAEMPGQVQTDAVWGILPSRTHFGMSALLPRLKNPELVLDQNWKLSIGGRSTEGIENRGKILSEQVSVATQVKHYSELQGLNREAGRQWVKEFQIAYIYHDQIDATGDKPANQDKVFAACEDALADLYKLIKRLTEWNVTQIWVTADHGFLYQRSALEDHDKMPSTLGDDNQNKHRCILSHSPANEAGVISLELKHFSHPQAVYVHIPQGAQRFRRSGGSTRYMHGGAMPQELCVPVVSYQHIKATVAKIRPKAGVQVLNANKFITNNVFTLQIFQKEAVGESIRPRVLRVWFESEQGEPLTNERRLNLNSESDHAPDREQRLQFTVAAREIQADMRARLRLVDDEDQIDALAPELWTLNLGFVNDFGI